MKRWATYLLERRQVGQDGPSDPRRVLPLRRGIDLDLDVLQRNLLDLVQQSVTEPLTQGRPA